jgi:ActR/RegA family two-component response regulator
MIPLKKLLYLHQNFAYAQQTQSLPSAQINLPVCPAEYLTPTSAVHSGSVGGMMSSTVLADFTTVGGDRMSAKLQALVIDDEPDITRLIAEVLRQEGWDVTEAASKMRGAGSRLNDVPEECLPLSVTEGRHVARVLVHTRGNKQAVARLLNVGSIG